MSISLYRPANNIGWFIQVEEARVINRLAVTDAELVFLAGLLKNWTEPFSTLSTRSDLSWHETECKAREAEAVRKVLEEIEIANKKPKSTSAVGESYILVARKIAEIRARHGEGNA